MRRNRTFVSAKAAVKNVAPTETLGALWQAGTAAGVGSDCGTFLLLISFGCNSLPVHGKTALFNSNLLRRKEDKQTGYALRITSYNTAK